MRQRLLPSITETLGAMTSAGFMLGLRCSVYGRVALLAGDEDLQPAAWPRVSLPLKTREG